MPSNEPQQQTSGSGKSFAPWPEQNDIFHTYDLHCHCGAVRYKMRVSPPLLPEHAEGKEVYEAVSCNCSICARHGSVNVHPRMEDVTFTRGEEDKTTYQYGRKNVEHWSCRICGCYLGSDITGVCKKFGVDEARLAVNLRMLRDIPLDRLKIRAVTAMSAMPPAYELDPPYPKESA